MSFIGVCWIASSFLALCANAQFRVPAATIIAYSPKGFQVSIPDQEGIKLFAFHGKINVMMEEGEAGDFTVGIARARNNRWTYNNRNAVLKVGDVLYYWLYVDYYDGKKKTGYTLANQQFLVRELVAANGTTAGEIPPRGTTGGSSMPFSVPFPVLTSASTCSKSATTVNKQEVCVGQLIFFDNFDGPLDGSKWAKAAQFSSYPDFPYVMYQQDETILYQSQGQLHIKPQLSEFKYGTDFVRSRYAFGENCTSYKIEECTKQKLSYNILPPVISAQISTKNSFSFRYGIIEIRARFPEGAWLYPDLYLQSKYNHYGQELASGLLRIAVSAGNSNLNKELFGGGVLGETPSARKFLLQYHQQLNRGWSEDFHTYKLTWKPDMIQLSVDNLVYGNIYAPTVGFSDVADSLGISRTIANNWRSGGSFAPYDEEMFLVMGVGAGGVIFHDFQTPSDFDFLAVKSLLRFYERQSEWSSTWNSRSTLDVDSVKVWAL